MRPMHNLLKSHIHQTSLNSWNEIYIPTLHSVKAFHQSTSFSDLKKTRCGIFFSRVYLGKALYEIFHFLSPSVFLSRFRVLRYLFFSRSPFLYSSFPIPSPIIPSHLLFSVSHPHFPSSSPFLSIPHPYFPSPISLPHIHPCSLSAFPFPISFPLLPSLSYFPITLLPSPSPFPSSLPHFPSHLPSPFPSSPTQVPRTGPSDDAITEFLF